MTTHARLSPSNHRWPHCPGSVREEAVYPDVAGEAAIDGTGSHLLLELCILNDTHASDYNKLIIGVNDVDKPSGWLVDDERCNRVQICLDYVTRRKKELEKEFPECLITVQAESRSNPGAAIKRNDWWGICDITITVASDDKLLFIEVIDYKDGRGYVSEKWNNQLIAYLFGKIVEYPNWEVESPGLRMTIVQPKTNTPIRYMCSSNTDHGLNKESLMGKVEWLTQCAAATDDPNAPLVSGKHCQWCNHNPKRGGTCTEMTEKSIETINDMTPNMVESGNDSFDIIRQAVGNVKSLSAEQLAKTLDSEPGFQAAFDKIKDEIRERIESGESIPGYAMLPGRMTRVWNDSEDNVVKKLKAKKLKKDQIYISKLISPAAALKLKGLTDIQKNKITKEMISEISGKMTLKKVEYDHKPVKDVSTMFAEIDDTKEPISFL